VFHALLTGSLSQDNGGTSKSLKGRRISKFFIEKKIFYSLVFDISAFRVRNIFFPFFIVKIIPINNNNPAGLMHRIVIILFYDHCSSYVMNCKKQHVHSSIFVEQNNMLCCQVHY